MNSNTKIEVPAVAWWVLIALIIPPLQLWIQSTFPGSVYVWAPLAVAVLGAVLKWISWVLAQNGQKLPGPDVDDGSEFPAPAAMQRTDEQYFLDYRELPARKFDPVDFFLGVKRG